MYIGLAVVVHNKLLPLCIRIYDLNEHIKSNFDSFEYTLKPTIEQSEEIDRNIQILNEMRSKIGRGIDKPIYYQMRATQILSD